MRYDVIVFDLDGTLVASAPGITNSVRLAAEQMGYSDFDPEVLKLFIGPPLHGSFKEHFGMDDAGATEAIRLFREHYDRQGVYECAVYPGVPRLLRRLKAGGARLYVASAKNAVFMRRVLAHLNLSHFFDGAVGAEPGNRSEDKSALVRAALPADAARVAMVGDRRFDIEAGRACGADTVGVAYGYGPRIELESADAETILGSVAELSDHLAGDVPQPSGLFITVEGLDGCGKTTQVEHLSERLVQLGYEPVVTREPGGSPIAEKIRHAVLTPEHLGMHPWTEALLYAAARAEHVRAVVRPALEAGRTVLCDRFVDSSAVYQGAGRGLGVENVLTVNGFATGGLAPDLTLYLRLDAETALARRAGATALDRIEMEQAAFHRRVFEAYEELARRAPARVLPVDASGSQEETAAAARAALDAALARFA